MRHEILCANGVEARKLVGAVNGLAGRHVATCLGATVFIWDGAP